jgi:cyclopropane-fatty-acyl-phospholipid synthase
VTSRLARAAVHAAFRRIEAGRIDLHEAFSARTLGFGPAEAELRAEVVVHDPAFYGRIAGDGSIGLGASYADGLWDTSDLMAVLRIAALEIGRLDRPRRIVRRLGRPLRRLRRDAFRNTVVGARRNIAAHLAELGYHRRFRRLWELYLAISAAGFAAARIMDVQMLFAKPAWGSRVGAGRDAAAVAQPA